MSKRETKEKLKKVTSVGIVNRLIAAGFAVCAAYSLFGETFTNFVASNILAIAGTGLVGLSALGYLMLDKPIEKQIEAVLKNVGIGVVAPNKEKYYPYLIHKHKASYGYKLIYALPPGISEVDFFKYHRELEIATKAEVEIYEKNSHVHIKAYTHKLPSSINMETVEYEEEEICVEVGRSRAGPERLSIVKEQHMLVAGETGCGKTNLLRVMAVQLANQEGVSLFVIDVKRNLGFLRGHSWFTCEHEDIQTMVKQLSSEMDRRYAIFDNLGIDELSSLPDEMRADFPHLVLIIDEFAGISPALAKRGHKRDERNSVVYNIVDILNRGRGAGIFCIIGVQRPDADTMSSGAIKANITCRFGFRTVDATNSRIILDNPMAALLPQDTPGRCILRGRNRLRQVQIYNLPLSKAKKMLPEEKGVPVLSLGAKDGACDALCRDKAQTRVV